MVFILIFVHTLISLQKLGKVSVIVDELIVRADLCDLAICHHHYDITLREKPNPMSHKKTNLQEKTLLPSAMKFANVE
jgi:hypothetical protein